MMQKRKTVRQKRYYENGGIPWNKGKKGVQKAWNKGINMHKYFKKKKIISKLKGRPAWNKGLTGFENTWNKGKKLSLENRLKAINNLPKSGKGEQALNWKGGLSSENRILRGSLEYKLWRKSVFERDEYKCQVCEKVGGRLEAHHIKEWAKNRELRFDTNNGITLCKDCHKLKHRKTIKS